MNSLEKATELKGRTKSFAIRIVDETVFWLELVSETGVVRAQRTQDLLKEANELVKIFGASLRTSKHSVK